jgi:hypothetical protein
MEADLDRLGGRQQGLLTSCQLQAAGWGKEKLRHAIARGVLIAYPERRGVYRVRGAPITREMAWLAAVLAAPADTLVGNLTSAEAWGFRWFAPDPMAIHLLTASSVRSKLPGVAGHRTISLPEHDRTRLRCVPITTPERTFVDVCGRLPYKLLGLAGDDLLRRKVLVLPKLVRCVEQVPASGRRKIRPMRRFLAERVDGYDPGGSEPELDVRRVLCRAHIAPVPVQELRVLVEGHRYRLDLAWPHVKHAFEYQGLDVHGRPSAVDYDSERTRRLQRAGWTIWPVTHTTTANEIIAIARFALGFRS